MVEDGDKYADYPQDAPNDVDKLVICEQSKNMGNNYFKQADYTKAIDKYEKVNRALK